MDKQEKNTILTNRDGEWKEQRHNASERNNRRYIIGITEWRRKCQLLPQMSLESILAKKNWTELLENQQRKAQACSGLMENISKLWGDNRPLTETIACLRSTKRWKLWEGNKILDEPSCRTSMKNSGKQKEWKEREIENTRWILAMI